MRSTEVLSTTVYLLENGKSRRAWMPYVDGMDQEVCGVEEVEEDG